MTWALNIESGQVENLADDQVTAAVSSGKYQLEKGKVRVLNPDGQLGSIDETDAQDAFAKGFKFATAADEKEAALEKKYGNRPMAAGAAGAARMMTFGLSDVAATKSGLASKEAVREVANRNKAASVTGELAGLGAGMVLEGGAPAVTSGLGGAAERAVLGGVEEAAAGVGRRVAAKAAGGAVEGGLYGLGNLISDQAIDDTPLTAEKVVALLGGGALAGAGLGAASVGLGEGANAAAKAFKGDLDDYAKERIIKAIAGNGHKKALQALEHKGIASDVADFAIEEGILTPLASPDAMAQRAAAAAERHGKAIGDAISFGDQAAKPLVNGADLADRVENEVVAKFAKGNAGDQAIAARLQREADLLRGKGDMSFEGAEEYKRSFDKHLDFGAEQKPVQEGLKQIRGIIKDDVEKKLDAVAASIDPERVGEFVRAKQGFRLSKEIQDLAEERALQLRNNRSISPSDYGVGGAIGLLKGGPIGIVEGLGGALLHKVARERGPQAFAYGLNMLAKALERDVGTKLASSPGLFGAFRPLLEGAMARGADDLLATHVALHRSDPAYRDTMAAAGYVEEGEGDGPAAMGRLRQLEAVQAISEAHDARVEAAARRFLGQQGGAAPKGERLPLGESRDARLEEFNKRAKRLEAMQEQLAEALPPPLGLSESAPGIAVAMAGTSAAAARFLWDKAPKAPPAPISALARAWAPTELELARWERAVRAVDSPASVLDDMKRGVVHQESVDALRAVYPRLLDDLRKRMLDRVSEYSDKLSPKQRSALSVLMGSSADAKADAALAIATQQVHAAAAKAEQQKQQAQANSRAKAKSIAGFATPAQRVEGRGAA